MAAITKAFIKFEHNFWGDLKEWNIVTDKRGYQPNWVVWDNDKKILLLIFYGDDSIRAESLTQDQFKDEMQEMLQKAFKGQDSNIFRPTEIKFHPWSKDENFLGGWSSFPAGALSTDAEWNDYECAVKIDKDGREGTPWLYFAGEGFSKEFHVFLHGAYHRGEECANKITADFKFYS